MAWMWEWALNVYNSTVLCSAAPTSLCVPLHVEYDYLDLLSDITLCLYCAFLQICRIENISHLSELQVLNLAGNNISRVENLQKLDCLTELNLRHNRISFVVRSLVSNHWLLQAFYSLHPHFTTKSYREKGTNCSVNTISFSIKAEFTFRRFCFSYLKV